MNINWKLKSKIFGLIDLFGADGLLYFIQKNITKRSRLAFVEVQDNWVIHEEHLSTLEGPHVLEFGAGKHLAQNLYLSRCVGKQTVVDLFPMLDFNLVNVAAQQVASLVPDFEHKLTHSLEELTANYAIDYRAPVDMRQTEFADGSFDACINTATLEHIPADDIEAIFREIKRIVVDGGLISMTIDYSDHYAHTDRTIGRLNFLQFSDEKFLHYRHNCHFLNRLRHQDHLAIFERLGFEVVRESAINSASPPAIVNERFDVEDPRTFATRGIILLRNRKDQ
jgi:SAM-dependent methyltransferase